MIKKSALILVTTMMLSVLPGISHAETASISSVTELEEFRNSVNSGNTYEGQTVTLSSSIDISSIADWEPIGTKENPFKGTFNGGGNTISNITSTGADLTAGLFGYTAGNINDLNVSVNISQDYTASGLRAEHIFGGGIAAYNMGNIQSCTASGVMTSKNNHSYHVLGGICAMNKGAVSGCTNTVRLSMTNNTDYSKNYGDSYAGGICGINEGTVTSSASNAQGKKNESDTIVEDAPGILAYSRFSSAIAGGVVGDNRGTISNVNSSGTVRAQLSYSLNNMHYAYSGGICGSNTGTVINSESECYVTSNMHLEAEQARKNYLYAGGISGYNKNEISDCIFNGLVTSINAYDTEAVSYTGGVCGFNYGKITRCEFGENAKITDARLAMVNRWNGKATAPDIAGGIVGYNSKGIIEYCKALGNMYPVEKTGNDRNRYYGGLVGENNGGVVSASYSDSDIILDGDAALIKAWSVTPERYADTAAADSKVYIGGLAGLNNGCFENCYYDNASANSLKAYHAGGPAGINEGMLENCFAFGKINNTLTTNGDGIAVVNSGTVNSCYYSSAMGYSETVEGTRKTPLQMRQKATYKNWPFDIVWKIGTRPSFVDSFGEYTFSDGSGTQADPYIIKTAEDLYNIRLKKDACYRLENDITYDGIWYPIGVEASPFTGTINGNHNTITVNQLGTASGFCGIIGYGSDCTLENLAVKTATPVTADLKVENTALCVGVIVAQGKNVKVENCSFDGNITVSGPFIFAGAIAGDVSGEVIGCRASGRIATAGGSVETNRVVIGGICGSMVGTMSACASSVDIVADEHLVVTDIDTDMSSSEIGGIAGMVVGQLENSSYIGEIINTSISQSSHTGGAVGMVDGAVAYGYANAAVRANVYDEIAGTSYDGITSESDTDELVGMYSNVEMTDSLLNTLAPASDGRYPWVKNETEVTQLHITPVWMVNDGFTAVGFEKNADCEIYYTTDGSNPIGSGALYTNPFVCGSIANLKYYAKTGDFETEIFSYGQEMLHLTPLQFTEMPTNQDGQAITKENVSKATEVNVNVLSDIDGAVKAYIVFFDGDVLKYASCKDITLTSSQSNPITFENISVSGASAVQIYVWNDTMTPYTDAVKF